MFFLKMRIQLLCQGSCLVGFSLSRNGRYFSRCDPIKVATQITWGPKRAIFFY